MKIKTPERRKLFVCLLVSLIFASLRSAESQTGADGSGAYATGHYRNLFAEAGHSQPEIRQKIDSAFAQLFHGNPTNQAVYYSAGTNSNGPLAYITDIKHSDVRTEGLSYGMIIAVEMNKKEEFDALWNWSNTYLYHADTNDPSYGFYSWQARTNGVRMSQFIAPDGEEYYVMALYFAANRWGSGKGLYDYKAQADQLLHRLRHRALITGTLPGGGSGSGRQITSGPLFDETNKMVLFSPSNDRPFFTDPSYHLPAFYELWSRWGPAEDREFWAGAAQASRNLFAKVTHPVTALNPHSANFDASPLVPGRGRGGPGFGPTNLSANATNTGGASQNTTTNTARRGGLGGGFGGGGQSFDYDAFRTAGNWSVDWSWWGKDVRERELSDKLQAFFESKGMTNYGCQFTLDGSRQLDDRHAQGLVAVNAVASLAATDPRSKEFVEALWNTPTPDGLERYYEGLLYMMSLLHCSGEFRIWDPQAGSKN